MAKPPYQHTSKSLDALRGSIAKWEAIVAGTGHDVGTTNCPLCVLYYESDEDKDGKTIYCTRCPVYHETEYDGCQKTPYDKWAQVSSNTLPRMADNPERLAAAQAELSFLRSLLPQDETNV